MVQKLNALIAKVVGYEEEHPMPSIELKTIYTLDGILDQEAV